MEWIPGVYILYFVVVGVGWIRGDAWMVWGHPPPLCARHCSGAAQGGKVGVGLGEGCRGEVRRQREDACRHRRRCLAPDGGRRGSGACGWGGVRRGGGEHGVFCHAHALSVGKGELTVFVRWQYIVALAHYAAACVVVGIVYRGGTGRCR